MTLDLGRLFKMMQAMVNEYVPLHMEFQVSLYSRFTENMLIKLAEYKLYLLGMLEVRWDKGGTESGVIYTFPVQMGRTVLKTEIFMSKAIIPSVKRLEFVGGVICSY
jgi:hypothetical protein